MSENVKAVIKNHEVPTDYKKCRELWGKVMMAFKKEKGLCVFERDMYNEILDFRMKSYKYPEVFIYHHNIFNMPNDYSIDIAGTDGDGALKYVRDKEGVCFQYTTDDPNLFIRFGLTDVINGCRYPFYQSSGVYVSYHHSDNDDGCAREVRTLSGLGGWNTRYFDENGNSNLGTNIRGFLGDLKHTIDQLRNL